RDLERLAHPPRVPHVQARVHPAAPLLPGAERPLVTLGPVRLEVRERSEGERPEQVVRRAPVLPRALDRAPYLQPVGMAPEREQAPLLVRCLAVPGIRLRRHAPAPA